ncbi:hypothetical protein JN09_000671 [Acholeplasma morum]|uniref:hypothetical protein n=1 Tax=Paracholeplasma morum TaxID=264637 RepID=UPI00195F0DB6|nr:hypothetical protein [Paracholeplasma morum]MBM7453345.1 hypothetical protein [Paracholeplasma morum]
MEKFAQWFIELFKQIMSNIWDGIVRFFSLLGEKLFIEPIEYIQEFLSASKTFGPIDWVFAIPSLVILFFLTALITVLVIQLFRRYIRFVKKEKDKEELLHEVSVLHYEIENLLDEKNAIMALSSEPASGGIVNGESKGSKKSNGFVKNRFPLLSQVDEAYRYNILQTAMVSEDQVGLNELVKRFVHFSASQLGLYYTEKTARIFFSGMAASKTMVLEGISGTGKTSLAYAMGKFFQNDAAIISVQPSWRDRGEMLGYFNEFTKKFNETDFLKAVYETTYRTDINFIVLDEMNLARVEYYFADFLSLLEMPDPSEWRVNLITDQIAEDPAHLENGKLLIPQNVWFIGTANRDDSTFAITDKVYDRVASIEMNDKATIFDAKPTKPVKLSIEYLHSLFKGAQSNYQITQKTLENLQKLDEFIIDKFAIAFGNRINKQIHQFIPVYVACGGDEIEALDYMVSRKIIRKFESLNVPFLRNEIEELIVVLDKLFGKQNFTDSKKMLKSFIKQFNW